MHDQSRLLKLLETATHSSATDNERLNALNAFRRICDKAGGLEHVFSNHQLNQAVEELRLIRDALSNTLLENARLEAERDALIRKMAQDQSRQSQSSASNSPRSSVDQPTSGKKEVIRGVLSRDWQELHRIHEAAKRAGFSGTSVDTKAYLDELCATEGVLRREPGTLPDGKGSTRWYAQSWKLKQGWAQAFRRS